MRRIIASDTAYQQHLRKVNHYHLIVAAVCLLFSTSLLILKGAFHLPLPFEELIMSSFVSFGIAGAELAFYFKNRRRMNHPKRLHQGRINDTDERNKSISIHAINFSACVLLIALAGMMLFGSFFNILYVRVAEVLIFLFSGTYFAAVIYLRKKM